MTIVFICGKCQRQLLTIDEFGTQAHEFYKFDEAIHILHNTKCKCGKTIKLTKYIEDRKACLQRYTELVFARSCDYDT